MVGGGTTGALACGMLCSSSVTKNWDIINIRSKDIPTIEVGESTIPQFAKALRFMKIEQEFFEKTSAWPKYGAIFKGWQQTDLVGGWPINGHREETINYLKGLTEQKKIPRSGQLVLEGKYPFHDDGFCSDVTVHIDANETAEFIFEKFDPQMDKVIYGNVNQVVITEDSINHIVVDGEVIQADYYIDATGFKRALINSFEPKFIKSKLPCNAAVYTSIEAYDGYETDMMTTSTAAEAGWMWNIPLKGKRGRGYVYSSDFLTEEEAAIEFGEENPSFLKYQPGWLETPAVANCFAIGLAAGFLDALDSPAIGMTVSQIFRFIDIHEHPTRYRIPFEKVEDYLMLHYKCCTKSSPFWDSIDSMSRDEVIDLYTKIINSTNWRPENFEAFTSSSSARLLSNTPHISSNEHLARRIYDTVFDIRYKEPVEEYPYILWTKELFLAHLSQGIKK